VDLKTGLTLDYILLSSDSGRLSIIEFVVTPTPHFESLYQEVFGKSGSRYVETLYGKGLR
jgi:splicing factor 3B subunit 3